MELARGEGTPIGGTVPIGTVPHPTTEYFTLIIFLFSNPAALADSARVSMGSFCSDDTIRTESGLRFWFSLARLAILTSDFAAIAILSISARFRRPPDSQQVKNYRSKIIPSEEFIYLQ